MKWLLACSFILIFGFIHGCSRSGDGTPELKADYPQFLQINLKNPSDFARHDAPVAIQISKLQQRASGFNPAAFVVLHDTTEIASQANDLDGDGSADEIFFVLDLAPKSGSTVTIRYAESGEMEREYTKRTQAELSQKFGGHFENREYIGGDFKNVMVSRVPPEHTDHSWFYRYEGPGWESDKVGYRFYLDWRNATDIFGKKTNEMVLQNVGLKDFDSYHEMSDWGMDILKVGDALGIGTIAMWHDDKANRVAVTDSVKSEIVENGPVFSAIRTTYSGWQIGDQKYGLVSQLSIAAGSRATKHEVTVSGDPDNLCTGIGKLENTTVLQPATNSSEWTYLATYGVQSLAEDKLGMAVLYRTADLKEVTEDELNHVVVLKPEGGELTYYFAAAWEKEPNGISTQEAFEQYLQQLVQELNTPVEVKL